MLSSRTNNYNDISTTKMSFDFNNCPDVHTSNLCPLYLEPDEGSMFKKSEITTYVNILQILVVCNL